jgi:hypothetical protein
MTSCLTSIPDARGSIAWNKSTAIRTIVYMPPASFSFLPSPISIVMIIANTLVVGYFAHVFHKLTNTVLFSEFTRWNELKRYHVIVSILGIGALFADILGKLGCSVIKDRKEQLPLECAIIRVVIKIPLLIAGVNVVIESVVFSYCRLYMILPGIFCV